MRLYPSRITADAYPGSFLDLYDELERRAVASLVERHETNSCNRHYDAVVCMRDCGASPNDVCSVIEESCTIWGLSNPTIEPAIDAAFSDRFSRRYALASIGNGSFVQKADLFEINELIQEKRLFRDWIIARRDGLEDCLRLASSSTYSRSLFSEIAHARAEAPSGGSTPTHYLIEGCAYPDSKEATAVLLESLLLAGRTPSPHVYYINCDNISASYRLAFEFDGRLNGFVNEAFVRAIEGNVVLLEYGREDFGPTYNKSAYALFRALIQLLQTRLDKTMLVLLLPRKRAFLERHARKLANVPFATITPDDPTSSDTGRNGEGPDTLFDRVTTCNGTIDDAMQLTNDNDFDELRAIAFDRMRREWMGARFASTGFPAFPPEISHNLALYLRN